MKTKYSTREEWLNAALELLKPEFKDTKVPAKIRVSCGFPSVSAFGVRKQRIGECWADSASHGKYFEIFISPVLSKPVKVLDVLIHEMVHAVVGLECGHKGAFKTTALAIGLTGKMTSTVAGPELEKRLTELAESLGPYGHDELGKMTNNRKKEGCRQLKCACPECGYTVRVTKKWLEIGTPTCPCGTKMAQED